MLSSQRFVCVRQKRLKPTLISNNSKNNRTSYNDKDKDTDKNKNTNQLSTTKNRKFKINSEMMNLLGCTKENFYKLIDLMNYKKSKEADTYYFNGENRKNKEKTIIRKDKTNPFSKLLALNIK